MNHAALRALMRILAGRRRRRLLAGCLRFALWLSVLHVAIAAAAAWWSVSNPLSAAPLQTARMSYAIWLLLPAAFLWLRSRPSLSLRRLARELDALNPQAPDPFRTALSRSSHNEDTLARLDRLLAPHLGSLRFPPALPGRGEAAVLAGALAVLAACALGSGDARAFFSRLAFPGRHLSQLPRVQFDFTGHRGVIGLGDTLRVRAVLRGHEPGQTIHALVAAGGPVLRFALRAQDTLAFAYGPVEGDLSLRFEAENGVSPMLRFRALAPPAVESLRVVVTPPGYTGRLPDTIPQGLGRFAVLPGSRVEWFIKASRPLRTFIFASEVETGAAGGPEADTMTGGRSFHLVRRITVPRSFGLRLEDEHGIANALPSAFRVGLQQDAPPELSILYPPEGHPLGRDMRLPLKARVRDDYGLSSLYMEYRVTSDGFLKDEGRLPRSRWLRGLKAGMLSRTWDLDSLDLRPENVLEFRLVAYDNDTVGGPKAGRSEWRSVRLPSVQEMIALARIQEQDALTSLRSALERQERVERKLKRLSPERREDAPPPVTGFEINRVMVHDPYRHLRKAQALVGRVSGELAKARGEMDRKAAPRRARDLERHLEKMEKDLPKGNAAVRPLEERLKELDRLSAAQAEELEKLENFRRELERKGEEPPGEKARLAELEEELRRNLGDQEDLRRLFEEEERRNREMRELAEQSRQEQLQMAQDVREAEKELSDLIRRSMKENLISPEILDKMERVQQMLSEILPDSLRRLLEKRMAGQEVDAEDLRRELGKMLERGEELEQSLDRALAMLEHLREMRRAQEWEKVLSELERREKDIAGSLRGKAGGGTEQKARQEAVRRRAEDLFREMERQPLKGAAETPESALRQKALEEMAAAQHALARADADSRSRAAEAASRAGEALGTMRQGLRQALSSGQGRSLDLSLLQSLLQESLELSRVQRLAASGSARRREAGWEGEEADLYASIHQIARWLDRGVKELAGQLPFPATVLLNESRLLVKATEEAARSYGADRARRALAHNQSVARELLKLQGLAQSMSGGGQGQGGSSTQAPGQGAEGGKGLSEQLKGISGKQMAVNQATRQLLRAMMQGRREGAQGMSPQSLANQEGTLAERLEAMAESAGDEGGAAKKLRALAEEARRLEEDMRRGRFAPHELQDRQERFQARLLEAATALEKRGYDDRREGRLAGDTGPAPEPESLPAPDELIRMLEEARRQARRLDLSEAQRRHLEEFYQTLMTR